MNEQLSKTSQFKHLKKIEIAESCEFSKRVIWIHLKKDSNCLMKITSEKKTREHDNIAEQ